MPLPLGTSNDCVFGPLSVNFQEVYVPSSSVLIEYRGQGGNSNNPRLYFAGFLRDDIRHAFGKRRSSGVTRVHPKGRFPFEICNSNFQIYIPRPLAFQCLDPLTGL